MLNRLSGKPNKGPVEPPPLRSSPVTTHFPPRPSHTETPGVLGLARRPASSSLQQTPCPHGVIADRLCRTTVTSSSLASTIKQWAHPCPSCRLAVLLSQGALLDHALL